MAMSLCWRRMRKRAAESARAGGGRGRATHTELRARARRRGGLEPVAGSGGGRHRLRSPTVLGYSTAQCATIIVSAPWTLGLCGGLAALLRSMDMFFWLVLCVMGTAIPMTLDLVRTFLPANMRSGRLIAAWHRPVLLAMFSVLCVWAYYLFWVSVLPYLQPRPFSSWWCAHAVLISLLWVNTVWNYVLCAAVDPGFVAEGATAPGARFFRGSRPVWKSKCSGYVQHGH